MLTRQSSRRSTGAEQPLPKKNEQTSQAGPELKKRKIHAGSMPTLGSRPPLDDKIDPVEKLLSFSHINTDILSLMSESEQQSSSTHPAPAYPNISCNFKKAVHENMRLYYSKFGRSHMDIHNDHSSFSVLNDPPQAVLAKSSEQQHQQKPRFAVPFFRNVNFNPTPTFTQIEDYIHYDDDEPLTTDSEQEELASPTGIVETPIPSLSGKMSFHYRQNDKLDLSLTGSDDESSNDAFRFLNKRSVISGKASEMIGTANFLVSDFFF